MELEIVFTPSAFKHGLSEVDILHAYNTKIYTGPLEDYDNKYAFIGFNKAVPPLKYFLTLLVMIQ